MDRIDTAVARIPLPARAHPASADERDDDRIIQMWLHGRSPHTERAYKADAARFLAFAGVGIRECRLEDLQRFADSLASQADSTRARRLAGVKSLFTFAHRIGYVPFNVGAPVRLPKLRNELASRILSEQEVIRMIDREPSERNRAILTLLYGAGVRLSELAGLNWRDLQARGEAGQIAVHGKGGKTRHVLLSARTWALLNGLRPAAARLDDPVFVSRKRDPKTKRHLRLGDRQVDRIVREAAKRADIDDRKVSPHWLRHAHASHALDRGAPVHLVQTTLGHESLATTGRYAHARPTESSSRFIPV